MGFNLKKLSEVKYVSQCKKVFTFLFSHFGICIMVIIYLMVGASIFQHLEQENEVKDCYDDFKDYHKMEILTLESLRNVIYSLHPESNASAKRIVGILETFGRNVMAIKYDGRDCAIYGQPNGPQYKWSWHGSLLFVVTVVSTIGYGHIAPKTEWGRIVCIAYAMIGIPLTMIFLATVGNSLANIFRFTYSRIIQCGCCKRKEKRPNLRQQRHSERPTQADNISSLHAVDSVHLRQHTKQEDMADDKTKNDTVLTFMDAREPTILDPVSNQDIADETKAKANTHPQDLNIMTQEDKQQINEILQQQQPLLRDDNESEEDDPKTGVPLTMAFVVIISHIVLGAILFCFWRNWDILQSIYFCFISIATIGFGDLVPGTDFTLPNAHAELVFGSIYILLGLALLSMCFALMQEEFEEKIKWVGRKLGVVQ